MKKINLRVFLVALLFLFSTVFVTGSALAQNKQSRPGWNNTIHVTQVNPPKLSVRPINSPDDIPAFRESVRLFIQELRAYIASLFD